MTKAIVSWKASALLVSSLLALSACGGGSSDSNSTDNGSTNQTETKTGVFLDAPVQGLGYQTPSQQGTTNANGEFLYQEGEQISFYYNGIELGSVPAQATVPITLLNNSTELARVVQTLDTDPDPNKINVSGITFPDDLIDRVEGSLAGENNLTTEELFSNQVLADLQSSNNVTFVNQSLVSYSDAADHLYDQLEHLPWSESDFSRQLYVARVGNLLEASAFIEDGAGTIFGLFADSGEIYGSDISWSINDNQSATINFDNTPVVITKLSAHNNEIDFYARGENPAVTEWEKALPLKLADLSGRHFTLDNPNDDECSAASMSFSETTVTINEQCPDGFFSYSANAEDHPLLDNALLFSTTENGIFSSIILALVEGTSNSGEYVSIGFTNGLFDSMNQIALTQRNNPVQP